MSEINRTMINVGIVTMVQATFQIFFTVLCITQYFCVIDFLRNIPLLLYIKILYFHNPFSCGMRINIGNAIDGMANQAFVLIDEEPFTAKRTFYINCVGLGLSVLWLFSSLGLMRGGARNLESKPVRWPWIMLTVAVCALDMIAIVTYANDSFHTRTLTDMMDYIRGTASGTGGVDVNTAWASWVMVLLYSRLIIIFFLNLLGVVLVVINVTEKRLYNNTHVETQVRDTTSIQSVEGNTLSSEQSHTTIIPRANITQSFRNLKKKLFRTPESPILIQMESSRNSMDQVSERSPKHQHEEQDKKRTVNFPANLQSIIHRMENFNISGRKSPTTFLDRRPTSRHLNQRRGTAAELQGQLPWTYIHGPGHRMRDQLPSNELLPPIPLPDYTALSFGRRDSVYRANSSLSSTMHENKFEKYRRNDVLY